LKNYFRTILLTIVLCLYPDIDAKQTIKVSTAEDSFIQEVSAAVLIEAYRQLSIGVEIVKLPNARSLVTSNIGHTDGEVSRLKGIDKKFNNLIPIPISINFLQGTVFSNMRNIEILDWKDIHNYIALCVRGIKFVEHYFSLNNIKCNEVTHQSQAINMLEVGRADLAVLPLLNGLAHIREQNSKRVKPVSKALVKVDLFHYLHKKHTSLVPALTKVLLEMKKSGQIEAIRNAYILSKMPFAKDYL